MFSREEASRIREEFWTAFGRYMSPVPSADGLKINWVNYHTRVKSIYFRMNAGQKSASIAISIEHRDPVLRDLHFEQFLELKTLLHHALGEEWQWQREALQEEGKTIAQISKALPDVSIFNRAQWPELVSFFKPRIIALDNFWSDARYSFDA